MTADDIKARLTTPRKRWESPVADGDLLSSGSTLLNLACTNRVRGCFPAGHYSFFVGDSASGKTWLALQCLAEAAHGQRWKNHRLIYDNAEDGALMAIERYFGKKTANRLEPPRKVDGKPVYSEQVEDFYYHLDDAREANKPFIYVLDSMDALTSKYSDKKFGEYKNARRKGKETAGDFGDGKAKVNSANIRRTKAMLRDTDSILLVIVQTRDNVDAGLFETKDTYSGGRALKFYAAFEIWTKKGEVIKKTVRGKPRKVGIMAKVGVRKNRITGNDRDVKIPIYNSVGVDDVGSCVQYLVDEGHWKKNKQGVVDAADFGFTGYVEEIVRKIEQADLEKQTRMLVSGIWHEIEEACAVPRKPRYK